jgi:hypothetical protein
MEKKRKLKFNQDSKLIIGMVLLSIAIVLVQVLIGIIVTLLYYY